MSIVLLHHSYLELTPLRTALISDEEISESEIPAKEPRAEPSKLEAEDYNDDDDEDDDDDDEGYEVEGIVGHKFKKGRLAFRIKWKGYDDPEDITTEPEDNLLVSPSLHVIQTS